MGPRDRAPGSDRNRINCSMDRARAVHALGSRTGPEESDFADGDSRRALALRFAPNPFMTDGVFQLDLPADARVQLRIYDLTGRWIRLIGISRWRRGRIVSTGTRSRPRRGQRRLLLQPRCGWTG